MTPLLWRSGLRHHLRHRWQLLLSLLGITLGVAVVIAVDITNNSARRAFELSVERVAGRATHQIVGGPLGLDQEHYVRLRREGLRPAAPVVEGYVSVDGRTFQLLGLDPFAEAPFRDQLAVGGTLDLTAMLTRPGTVALGAETAKQLGVAPGDPLPVQVGGRPTTLHVASLLQPADDLERRAVAGLMLADIATAQEVLAMAGRLSRIDLILAHEKDAQALRQRLPPPLTLERSESRSGVMAQMTRAFAINLTALSLLALLVGLFLIYNTMSFSVVQRRPLFATLRALGTGRADLFQLVLAEALLLGILGSVLGALLGMALAEGLVRLVTRTINDLYFVLNVTGVFLSPLDFLKGALLGVGGAAVAAAAPAWDATRSPPRLVWTRSHEETRGRRALPAITAAGLATCLVGALLLVPPNGGLLAGFGALFVLIVGFALLVPATTWLLLRALEGSVGRWLATPGRLALRGVRATLSRTAVAIAALAVAVSVGVGMGILVDSFRDAVRHWLEYTLRADIYISPPAPVAARHSAPLHPGVMERVRATPGVSHLATYRAVEVASPSGPVQLQAVGLAPESRAGYRFAAGEPARIWPAFAAGAVLISEPFAFRHDLAVGDHLTLSTERGLHSFPVAGIFYDYESDRGIVEIARAVYERHFDDAAVTGLGVYLTPEAAVEPVLEALHGRLNDLQNLRIRSSRDLRSASLAIFDRTFTITEVLRLLAVLVAFAGVFSALMALQLERSREFAILRATGMTPRELSRLITGQSGLMGLVAGLLALPLGILLAVVLIEVINRRAFGWSLDPTVDPTVLAQGLLLAVVAALLAGWYPARRLARTPPAVALREE